MADIESEIGGAYARHQAMVREQRDRLRALDPDEAGYAAAFEDLVGAVEGLLVFEGEIPAMRQEPHRLRSQRVVTWSGRMQAVLAVGVGLVAIPGWIGWGWVVLLVVHLVTAVNAWGLEVTAGRHHAKRVAAVWLNVLGVLVAVLCFGVISGWFTVLYLFGAVAVNVVLLEIDQEKAKGARA